MSFKNFIWLKCSLLLALVAAGHTNAQGFKCAEKQLESTIEIEGEFTRLADVCGNLTFLWFNASVPGNLVIEHSAYPLPGSGKILLDTDPTNVIALNDRLASKDLVTRMNNACGRSYLVGSYKVSCINIKQNFIIRLRISRYLLSNTGFCENYKA